MYTNKEQLPAFVISALMTGGKPPPNNKDRLSAYLFNGGRLSAFPSEPPAGARRARALWPLGVSFGTACRRSARTRAGPHLR